MFIGSTSLCNCLIEKSLILQWHVLIYIGLTNEHQARKGVAHDS